MHRRLATVQSDPGCDSLLQCTKHTVASTNLSSLLEQQDQCTKLNTRPDTPQRAFNLSSSCADSAAEELALEQALTGPPRAVLLFCTPERLCFASFTQKLKDWHAARPFAYIVVDEAHLVAEQVLAIGPAQHFL